MLYLNPKRLYQLFVVEAYLETCPLCFILLQKSAATKQNLLKPEERMVMLEPLLHNSWSVCSERDAIQKEFIFSNFNEVFFSLKKACRNFFFYLNKINCFRPLNA